LWVSGSKNIAAYRKDILEEQGGVCAILGEPVTTPCLDHDHYDGKCRGVIGSSVNMFEGQIQKLWSKHLEGKTNLTMTDVLRRIADYLEEDKSDMKLHGEIITDLKKNLKRWNKETIASNGLKNFGLVIDGNMDKAGMIAVYITEFVKTIEDSYLYETK